MKKIWSWFLLLGAAVAYAAAAQETNPCAVPTPYPEGDWRIEYCRAVKAMDFSDSKANVLLLGDSMMQMWNPHDRYPNAAAIIPEFEAKYPQVRLFRSFGVSGDKPENTLWLLTEEKILAQVPAPNVIVLMVGVNSLLSGESAEHVSGGVAEIVAVLRKMYPDAKILLLGIWQCFEPGDRWQTTDRANEMIARLDDGKTVFYRNFGNLFLTGEGKVDMNLLHDGLHPSEAGFRLWAENMFPLLDELMVHGTIGDAGKQHRN